MGNALLRLDKKSDAIREYRMARDLQPHGQIAQFCEAALRKLEVPKPAIAAKGSATTKVSLKQPQLIYVLAKDPLSAKLESFRANAAREISRSTDFHKNQFRHIRCKGERVDQKVRHNLLSYSLAFRQSGQTHQAVHRVDFPTPGRAGCGRRGAQPGGYQLEKEELTGRIEDSTIISKSLAPSVGVTGNTGSFFRCTNCGYLESYAK